MSELKYAYSPMSSGVEIVSWSPLRVRFQSEGNRTRAASIVPCGMCQQPVVVDSRRKSACYCSKKCLRLSKGSVALYCEICGKGFVRASSKVGKYTFCSRECKEYAQSWESAHGLSNETYGERVSGDRRRTSCVSCGETQYHRLVIHHIDGDRSNNASDNLECVCRNCHADRHVDDNGRLNTKVLTPRERLKFYEY